MDRVNSAASFQTNKELNNDFDSSRLHHSSSQGRLDTNDSVRSMDRLNKICENTSRIVKNKSGPKDTLSTISTARNQHSKENHSMQYDVNKTEAQEPLRFGS